MGTSGKVMMSVDRGIGGNELPVLGEYEIGMKTQSL